MSKNRVIVTIGALLVVLAVLAVAKTRNGGSEIEDETEEVNEEEEAR